LNPLTICWRKPTSTAERLNWPDRVQPWDRGVVLYDLSRLLLALEPTAGDRARTDAVRMLEA